MRRSRQVIDRSWPSWRYGPNGESAIFNSEPEVPVGWTKKPGDTPDEIYVPRATPEPVDREELIAELFARGIDIGPTWGIAHMKKVLNL